MPDAMKRLRIAAGLLGIFLAGLAVSPLETAHAQTYEGVELVRADLVTDQTAVVPGGVLQVGVVLDLAPGWHIYWRNPGDAGLATELTWEWPAGWEPGEQEWPVPLRIIEPGDLQVFAYKKQALLWHRVRVPADFSGEEATIRVRATWLVCEAICVPGSASLEITLPVETTSAPRNAELFAEFTARLPSPDAPPFSLTWQPLATGWNLILGGNFPNADFLPEEPEGTDLPADPHVGVASDGEGSTTLSIAATHALRGILKISSDATATPAGWKINSPEWTTPAESESLAPATTTDGGAPALEKTGEPSAGAAPSPTLWLALIYGFIGGFILNLMPCVLPVISLKVFGFIRQAGESPWRIFAHGLSFIAGIFTWFLGLGLLIVVLKSTGAQVTWAFQFQNPWFILFISVLVFVFALNLFGVFEVVLPGRAGSGMADLAGREGLGGSFFQGIFATLLATPCTAPFLGTALGFAFAQPGPVILAMFASVAAGMGFPYLLLSARPGWIRFLPKPGAWMERLKQFMGFPLLATLLWLLSILAGQKGIAGVLWTLALLLAFGFACWLYGSFCGAMSSPRTRRLAGALALLTLLAGGYYFGGAFSRATPPRSEGTTEETSSSGIAWQPFSREKLDALLAEGKPVFIDFTADWCLTCKFNERTAINTPAVREVIRERGIVPLKADWTNANPEITKILAEFGRVGVPFYLFYPKGREIPPVVFPELVTEKIILDGLQTGAPSPVEP